MTEKCKECGQELAGRLSNKEILIMTCFMIVFVNVMWYVLDLGELQERFEPDSIIIKVDAACFLNGYEIDCEDNRTSLPIVPTQGNFDIKPTFKYDKRWIDVLGVCS